MRIGKMKKRLLFPWEKEFTIVCPICGGKTVTTPIWFWEKQADKIARLQSRFCHAAHSGFIEQIPVLSENDLKSRQKRDDFWKELDDESGKAKPYEDVKYLFIADKEPPQIFLKHGIFALIWFFTETELKALFLFLSMDGGGPKPVFFEKTMQISKSYVCMILGKLRKWKLAQPYRYPAKGRAGGRQLVYTLTDQARRILDQNVQDHDFVRKALVEMVKPIAERMPNLGWRKDLLLMEKSENEL